MTEAFQLLIVTGAQTVLCFHSGWEEAILFMGYANLRVQLPEKTCHLMPHVHCVDNLL